jgi:hypothetical protein
MSRRLTPAAAKCFFQVPITLTTARISATASSFFKAN